LIDTNTSFLKSNATAKMRLQFRFILFFSLAAFFVFVFLQYSRNDVEPQVLDLFEAKQLRCHKYFEVGYNLSERTERMTFEDPELEVDLPMNCDAIRQRSFFQMDELYPEEREFPIAFARAVYRVS
jgi:hypothetical protein